MRIEKVSDIGFLKDESVFCECLSGLPDFRREKALRFRTEEARRQSVGAWLLLMDTLCEWEKAGNVAKGKETPSGSFEISLQLVYGPAGKPEIEGRDDVHFNISHSGDKVMCVVSDKPVGCDIERIEKDRSALERIAKRAFSPVEYDFLSRMEGEEYSSLFYRIWTRKESFIKAVGSGFGMETRDFSLLPEEDLEKVRDRIPAGDYIFSEGREDGYQWAVCEILPK